MFLDAKVLKVMAGNKTVAKMMESLYFSLYTQNLHPKTEQQRQDKIILNRPDPFTFNCEFKLIFNAKAAALGSRFFNQNSFLLIFGNVSRYILTF